MPDLNHVVLIGRLTRDAELKYTANGQAVCKFSIAVNRRRKNGDQWEDEANFFDIVVWGRQGEAVIQYLVKGKLIGVDGELRQDRWVQDGQNRSKIEVVANNLQLLGGGLAGSGSSGNNGASAPGGSGTAPSYGQGGYQERRNDSYTDRGPPPREPAGGVSSDGFTDDIPF
ncbi:MAG: single-stranded DNA-binding protein [Spirochaetaceae bacterium]|jgi:single-strand DNA-binding protein|nr:single-stranded DNA-binding protein [Spirochaetaceae bacterium]